ncbi:uncharacterized protein LOC144446350 [Glandiceps talaboti]
MSKISAHGRRYDVGKATGKDLRSLVVQEIEERGGLRAMAISPRGVFIQVAKKYRLHHTTVKNIWLKWCQYGTVTPETERVGRTRKLLDVDVEYIEAIKSEQPSATTAEVKARFEQHSLVRVSASTINRTVRDRLTGGKWTYKKINRMAMERFTNENMIYTQDFIDLLHQCDPHRLKFMDESGFKVRDIAYRSRGHSLIGEKCVEVVRYHQSPNVTLNLLMGLNGVMHVSTLDGASNSATFLDFIGECVDTVTHVGLSALGPGDILVIDNAPIHHSQEAKTLARWLAAQDIDYIFTPKYSPEMNPAENCFSKIKKILPQPYYKNLIHRNIHVAIHDAVSEITAGDTHGYFRHLGYLNMA